MYDIKVLVVTGCIVQYKFLRLLPTCHNPKSKQPFDFTSLSQTDRNNHNPD